MSKILYVDDDSENLVVFEALCAGRFDTLTAESGQEALTILGREEIGVLLADQRMPGMTGVELAERASKDYPDVVRILITAYTDLSEAVDAINRGQIRSYLRKPWDQQELLATLKAKMARRGPKIKPRPSPAEASCGGTGMTIHVTSVWARCDRYFAYLALCSGVDSLVVLVRIVRSSLMRTAFFNTESSSVSPTFKAFPTCRRKLASSCVLLVDLDL